MDPTSAYQTPRPPTRRRLYDDVLKEPDRTGRFFRWPHPTAAAFQACARHLDCSKYNRARASEILLRQNEAIGAPQAALDAARDLAKPGSVCAFTGQQAGLFGGPLYTVYKALTLLGWAERLRPILKRPVVPVFWIAADDHDFEEVRWSAFPDLENETRRVELPATGIADRTPVSHINLTDQIRDLIAELRSQQLATEFSEPVFESLSSAYRPGASMSEAFARWMSQLLGPLGLVMFDPSQREGKELMRPLFEAELLGHADSATALSEINQRLDEAGYDRQVSHPDGHTHLFVERQGRHAIRNNGDGTLAIESEGEGFPAEEWINRLKSDSAAFSSGVLLRPVAQSYAFPVVATVCGPSEIAYWAQSRALFDRFNTVMPVVLPRSCATIVEHKNRRAAESLGHKVEEFFRDIEALINTHFERSFPSDLDRTFEGERAAWEKRLAELKRIVTDFEPTLEKTFEVDAGKINNTWDHLQKKVFQAHKRKGDEIRTRFYKLAAHLYPGGHPQERVYGIVYYLNKYGFDFIARVREQLKIGTPEHQIIEP
ncbi:MAG: bacillithiol biosynthesis cysteine-adding enzyme BshC [Candidatus Zixiibacteriota bacterium]